MPEKETILETEHMKVEEEVPTTQEKMTAEIDARMERIEAANRRQEELNAEAKTLLASIKTERMLAGNTHAGEDTNAESAEDYAKRVMANEDKPKSYFLVRCAVKA